MRPEVLLGLTLGLAIIAVVIVLRLLQKRGKSEPTTVRQIASASRLQSDSPGEPQNVLALARHYFYCRAFGVNRFDYTIRDEHAAILAAVRVAAKSIAHQEQHFPRRPLLIPQLMRAINDEDSSRGEIAHIILQDPVLAADVLRIANGSYYRISREPVETIDRALALLGTDGIRSVVATSIMQPVFRLPKGYFDPFSTTLWDHAQRSAAAASAYAGYTRSADRYSAQLVGLLAALGPLALFRLVVDAYRRQPAVLPRAEVFIRIIDEASDLTSAVIAQRWDLPPSFVAALEEQGNPHLTSALAWALHAGRWASLLSLGTSQGLPADEARKAVLATGVNELGFDRALAALAATGMKEVVSG